MSKTITTDLIIVAEDSDEAERLIAEWVKRRTTVARTLRNGFYEYQAVFPPSEITAEVTDSAIPSEFRVHAGVGTDEAVEVYGTDRVVWSEHDADGVLHEYATWQLEVEAC